MTNEEYEEVYRYMESAPNIISVSCLKNHTDRTLLYGYTCDRKTWHIYLKDGLIHLNCYGKSWDNRPDFYENYLAIDLNDVNIIPDKRLYPFCCDYEFVKLLKSKGIDMTFTTWEEREPRPYYGEIV